LRPAEALAGCAGALLAVSLFLPWYEFSGGRENAWQSLTVAEIPAALAAMSALALVLVTIAQRSPALPLAVAVVTVVLGTLALIAVGVRAIALPPGALERCYGLWLGLAGSLGVLVAAILSLRDERPFWGVPVAS
jgi:hypothetical protein